jgi:4-alpha-glucanotransferase
MQYYIVNCFHVNEIKDHLKGAGMILTFKIDYQTHGDDHLLVGGSSEELGKWNPEKAVLLNNKGSGEWETELKGDFPANFEYKYLIKNKEGYTWEMGKPRKIEIDNQVFEEIRARDFWRPLKNAEVPMYSSAFSKVLMRRETANKEAQTFMSPKILRLQIMVPKINPRYKLAILGDQPLLGNWQEEQAVIMEDSEFPLWKIDLDAGKIKFPFQFKYAVYDQEEKKVLIWEQGSNRMIRDFVCKSARSIKIHTDEKFRFQTAEHWKGAGVSVPLFSLRTEKSGGIGEYPDLMKMVDWAKQSGLKLIQLLPLNDTIATHTWTDSYPYKSISTMALNPDYININKIGILEDENLLVGFMKALKGFNAMETVHYEDVHKIKGKFFKFIFEQQMEQILQDPSYQKFLDDQKEWLVPYGAFCYLRDKYKTAGFKNWPEYSVYNQRAIEELSSPGTNDYSLIAIHYFIQYQAYKQMLEAAEYARSNGIVLKGDIPIGISPNSVDAWMHPEWFNLDQQAGAPPDEFSDMGQIWGFPTYRWDKMAEDGYSWWIKRLKHLSLFFDAVRIDHIQGLFRIWEIPVEQIQGIMGHYSPAQALKRDEIMECGLMFNEERYTKPYIREYFLHELFGNETEEVKSTFLREYEPDKYNLKSAFDTQKKIWDYFEQNKTGAELTGKETRMRDGLCNLISEVIFLRDPQKPNLFHPRYTMQDTNSYLNLKDESRFCLDELYQDFFYSRNEELWRKHGLRFLPVLLNSTGMMVCGEDLGTVPACVRDVMRDLSILSLEIERMTKNQSEFSNPSEAPYLSVCSTSTHDTSTLRGWWEEDRGTSQRFFKSFINKEGEPPVSMEPWLVKEIINQHLLSPAMWVIFPIQDILALNADLRYKNIQEERINVPAIAQNYWRYRMHLRIEDLINNRKFSTDVQSMISSSGR